MSANIQLSGMFSRMADVMQLKGGNAFKAIAFQKVARVLEELDFDVAEAARAGALPPIEGVGESSRRVIEQFANKGSSEDYAKVMADVPPGVLAMLKIPGLGPKTVALLWKERQIESTAELEKAIAAGKLTGVKGLGDKKIAAMLDGIRLLKAGMERRGMMDVAGIVAGIAQRLRDDPRVGGVEIAGSFRRRKETVGDADLICWTKEDADAPAIGELFRSSPDVEKVLASGDTKSSILVSAAGTGGAGTGNGPSGPTTNMVSTAGTGGAGGFQIDLRIVPRMSFGAALQYFTGSKEHNVKLRGLANDKGYTLNEWGLYRIADYEKAVKKSGEAPQTRSVAGLTEESVYETLGLQYVPPELREDRGEIEAAIEHKLPDLITRKDIRGELHSHTTASDGNASIEAMAEAAKAMGYEYIAITDHSPSSVIANGLSPERLKAHIRHIHHIREKVKGIHIFAGSEVDIHPDGTLDYEDALLAELDVVIASPHSSLKQDPQKANDRLLCAIDSRYVHVIGHPTGRMINQRDGLPLDMAKLIERAAKAHTALEINAGWPRWDLNDLNARSAWQHGVMLAINTDAHSPQGLGDIEMGLWIARRGWVTPEWVINCLPLKKLEAWLAKKR